MAVGQVVKMSAGERVACPKCGRLGVVAVEKVRAKGHEYWYVVVRHYEPPDYRVRKCYISRTEGPAGTVEVPAKVPAAGGPKPVRRVETVSQRFEGEARGERVAVKEVPSVGGPEAVDRVAWYATKIAIAWGAVRVAPSEETFQSFVNVARQIGERVGVDTSTAVAAVNEYYVKRTKDATIAATTAVKEVVKQMFAKMGTYAEVPAREVVTPKVEIDFEMIRNIVREEVERVVSAVVAQVSIPEVCIGKAEMEAAYRVFRKKQRVDEVTREVAYKVWAEVFREGRKVVEVRV